MALNPVSDEYYAGLKAKKSGKSYTSMGAKEIYTDKEEFDKANMFRNRYVQFSVKEILQREILPENADSNRGKCRCFFANVNFEPGCRNNWHIHHATKNGGQLLVCTVGQGWYQEEGKEPVSLREGFGCLYTCRSKALAWS